MHKLKPLRKRLSKSRIEKRATKMDERTRLGKRIDEIDAKGRGLGNHYGQAYLKGKRALKIAVYVAAAQIAAIVALAGRAFGFW